MLNYTENAHTSITVPCIEQPKVAAETKKRQDAMTTETIQPAQEGQQKLPEQVQVIISKKQRKANAAYSKWSFAELQAMITYKAPLHKSIAIKVDADNTSKACPMCGHTCDENRPRHGLLFVCQNCHYTLHADLIGARNITMRTLLVRQDWTGTGQLSVVPEPSGSDVSSVEAKAARLQRYAELRWSLDTSPA